MIDYDIEISINVGNALPPVGELVNQLNDHVSSMSYNRRGIPGNLFSYVLKSQREFNEEDMQKVKSAIEAQFNERQQTWQAKVESIRRRVTSRSKSRKSKPMK